MNSSRNKVVVITGAASGIGAETAKQLHAKGARVVLVDRTPSVVDVAAGLGDGALGLTADVTDAGSIQRAIAAALDAFGQIDVIIANAGISGPSRTIAAMTADDFEEILAVNLTGAWRTVTAALPYVVEQQGYVLVVASVAAIRPLPMLAAYSASKAGAEAFTRALGIEIAQTGTKVGVAYFGGIDTPMTHAFTPQPGVMDLLAAGPGTLTDLIPASDAAAAIVHGVERRSSHVYAPRYVGAVDALRGAISRLDPALGRWRKLHDLILASGGLPSRTALINQAEPTTKAVR